MKRRMVGSMVGSAGPAVVAVGAALLVAGCGAGQITQTDTQVATINGTSVGVGTIAIRNAEIDYPEASQGQSQQSQQAQQEHEAEEAEGLAPAVYPVNSDAEISMWIVNEGYEGDELVSARSDIASNMAIEGSRSVPAQRTLVLNPASGELSTDEPTRGQLTLEGLKRQLRPGQLVQLTLTFRDAGSVTFDVPVTAPDDPRSNPNEPEGHGGGH
ncbi:copper chaperone PCu(A)C [Saccharomonospora piscinae]|uniref:copper chaperone PCu(A)C n=1 Tax=Saccharomonospora piscinae TaxID=687388 RepID=UPI0004676D61|nr:copper chaperone PCu(A)C [Saccharomonospora piscinae]